VCRKEITINGFDFSAVAHHFDKPLKIQKSVHKSSSTVVTHVVDDRVRSLCINHHQKIPTAAPFGQNSGVTAVDHPFLTWFEVERRRFETWSRR
jgi:hypothetical protein